MPEFWERAVEFLGLSEVQARELAAARGLWFRDLTLPEGHTDDLKNYRVNVWLEDGLVTRAVIF